MLNNAPTPALTAAQINVPATSYRANVVAAMPTIPASGGATEGNPGDGAFGKLRQGALEGSNVQVVEEMVDMIAAQRTYEMNTKVLSAADNMLQYLAQAAR